jgi:hydroxymethylglutaryl-CoA lyase
MERVPRPDGVAYAGLVLNRRGLDRPWPPGSTRSTWSSASARPSTGATRTPHRESMQAARRARRAPRPGCSPPSPWHLVRLPVRGRGRPGRVVELAPGGAGRRPELCLADTIGVGVPSRSGTWRPGPRRRRRRAAAALPLPQHPQHRLRQRRRRRRAGATVLDASAGGSAAARSPRRRPATSPPTTWSTCWSGWAGHRLDLEALLPRPPSWAIARPRGPGAAAQGRPFPAGPSATLQPLLLRTTESRRRKCLARLVLRAPVDDRLFGGPVVHAPGSTLPSRRPSRRRARRQPCRVWFREYAETADPASASRSSCPTSAWPTGWPSATGPAAGLTPRTCARRPGSAWSRPSTATTPTTATRSSPTPWPAWSARSSATCATPAGGCTCRGR